MPPKFFRCVLGFISVAICWNNLAALMWRVPDRRIERALKQNRAD